MKLEIIPNRGPASMAPEIEAQLELAKKVYIASAFISPSSIEWLKDVLEKAKKNNRKLQINLLIGLYQRFNSASTISKAIRLQKTFPERFCIRIARNNRFHWKVYNFANGNIRNIYIGSANFTEDGLTASGEITIKISSKNDDRISKILDEEFDYIWKDNRRSFSPSAKFIKRYRRYYRPPRFVRVPGDDFIGNLLDKAERYHKRTLSIRENNIKPRLIFADLPLQKDTIKTLKKYRTSWDKANWDYICFNYRPGFEYAKKAKLIIYITCYKDPDETPKEEYYIEFRIVEDSAEIKTPDGKYFIAHSRIPYTRKIQYGNIMNELRKSGLSWKKMKSDRYINKKQLTVICNLFHVKLSTIQQYLQ